MTAAKAYRQGWNASKRWGNGGPTDLERAEDRFIARHGGDLGPLWHAFCQGWEDYACDYEFNPPT